MLPAIINAVLGLAFGLGSVSTITTTSDDAGMVAAQEETQVVPTVRVEIKLARAVLKSKYQRLAWGEPDAVELTRGDKTHRVDVTVDKRDEKGSKLTVTLAYERDGVAVIAPYTFDTRAKKREIVSTDGGIAVAVTVKPRAVTVKTPGRKDRLEGHDSDDPLAGLP
ncbi:MAG: hypothetical protein AAF721_39755 [Myxococcota bacterium]